MILAFSAGVVVGVLGWIGFLWLFNRYGGTLS